MHSDALSKSASKTQRTAEVGKADKVVILDDDPTGCQSVKGIPVLTEWSVSSLVRELEDDTTTGFFLLTNTRSMKASEARRVYAEVCNNLKTAMAETGRAGRVLSRSDSTLRGHFPLDTDTIAETLGLQQPTILLLPAFIEGGRLTKDDIHYVVGPEGWVPAGETEFAKDRTFGYRSSNLRDWAVEKSNGTLQAEDVASVSIETLRTTQKAELAELLASANARVLVANAVTYADVEKLAEGVQEAEAQGKTFIYRTGASFARARLNQDTPPLYQVEHAKCRRELGGLVMVGSYVKKTTAQLSSALSLSDTQGVEIDVSRVLAGAVEETLEACTQEAIRIINAGHDAIVYTSRGSSSSSALTGDLDAGKIISSAVNEIADRITRQVQPHFIVAKGGITSHDIAQKVLHISRAMTLGALLPGVPVLASGPGSRFPELPYVIFPGNVGDEDGLAEAIKILRA